MYIIRVTEEKKENRVELVSVIDDNPETILYSIYISKDIPLRMEIQGSRSYTITGISRGDKK